MGTSHNGPKTSVKDPTKFLDFLGGLLLQRIRCKDQTARIWLLRTFRSANGFYNARNAFKVRGHPAIAQFSGVDRIVDDRYSARVSSCDCSRKSDRLPG